MFCQLDDFTGLFSYPLKLATVLSTEQGDRHGLAELVDCRGCKPCHALRRGEAGAAALLPAG